MAVQPEIGYPGRGFFLLARELGLNTYCDDRSFFSHELKRVHEYWSKRVVEYQPQIYLQKPVRSGHNMPLAVH